MISNINFFIDTCRSLQPHYIQATEEQKNQLSTFLKTWIFYNSGSQKTFWTGKFTLNSLKETKEHWFPGKPVVKQLLADPNLNNYSKGELILRIFKYMQWNYTTQAENQALRPFQTEQAFFSDPINGDPLMSYQLAGLRLMADQRHKNQLPILEQFINGIWHGHNPDIVVQLTLKSSHKAHFLAKCNQLGITNVTPFGDKYILFSGSLANFQIAVFSTLTGVLNSNQIIDYLNQFGENTPIRTFPFDDRGVRLPSKGFKFNSENDPHPFYCSTHRGAKYLFPWFQKFIDRLDGDWVVFDDQLNIHPVYITD